MKRQKASDLDKRATQKNIVTALEKYRLFKYLDAVGKDEKESEKYCKRIENVVKRLPSPERFLVEQRYMTADSEYLTDLNVYCFKFDPPISASTYATLRWKAFSKLALALDLGVRKDEENENL